MYQAVVNVDCDVVVDAAVFGICFVLVLTPVWWSGVSIFFLTYELCIDEAIPSSRRRGPWLERRCRGCHFVGCHGAAVQREAEVRRCRGEVVGGVAHWRKVCWRKVSALVTSPWTCFFLPLTSLAHFWIVHLTIYPGCLATAGL